MVASFSCSSARVAALIVRDVLECARVLGRGLPVRGERRGCVTGCRAVPHGLVRYPGTRGVVGEKRHVCSRGLQHGQRRAVQLGATEGRHGVLDGAARQLVTETVDGAVRDEGPRDEALVDHRARQTTDRLQDLGVGRLHQHSCGLEKLLRVLGHGEHPGRDDIRHGAGDAVGVAGERLHDVERVAAGELEELVGVAGSLVGEMLHRLGAQRRQRQASGGPVGDQVGQRLAMRAVCARLPLTEGDHDQRSRALDAPRQEAEPVEGRLVGPVQVLDDDTRGRR